MADDHVSICGLTHRKYSQSELYPAPGLTYKNGEQVCLFSSRHPQTVQRHFHWMARHGIDGAFLQRFAGQCDLDNGKFGIRRLRDEIGDRVREAAEREGRVFAIMYDVSGVPADRIAKVIEMDWIHLLREKTILDSPNYLREKGKPVVALWGFGFNERHHTPDVVKSITNFIRQNTPGGAYIMAGTPTHWRTATEDADRNPEFLDVWLNEFDAISPWMVGRLRNNVDVDTFADYTMKFDIELLRKRHEQGNRKVDYIPVVYPGFSGLNLSEGRWGFNHIKRDGGRFLWKQIFNAKRLGVRTMYGAMWDEYDEGTAFMPVVEKARLLPDGGRYPFLALDADGYDLPADWYMRICGFAAEGLRSERMVHETFPSKELQDYWSGRPRYEAAEQSGSGEGSSAGGSGQAYEDWLQSQKESKDELPPPPYSLEAEDVQHTQPSANSGNMNAAAPTTSGQFPVNNAEAAATPQSGTPVLSSTTLQPQTSVPSSHGVDVNALTNDFARHGIASAAQPASSQIPNTAISFPPMQSTYSPSSTNALTDTTSRPPLSPPPLHPQSRPRPNLASRPSSRPRPSEEVRPQRPGTTTPPGPQFPSPHLQQDSWPPSDWGVHRHPSQQAQYQAYPRPSPSPSVTNHGDGALSHRPHGTPSPQPSPQLASFPHTGESSTRPQATPVSPHFPGNGPYPPQQQYAGSTNQSSGPPVAFPLPSSNNINSNVAASLEHVNVMNSYSPSSSSIPTFPQAGLSQYQQPQSGVAYSAQYHPHTPHHQSSYDSNPYSANPSPSAYQGSEHHTNYGSAEQSYSSYGASSRPPMIPAGNGGYRPSYTQPSHQGPPPNSRPPESQYPNHHAPPPPPPRPAGTPGPAQYKPPSGYPGGYSANTPGSSSSSTTPGNFPGSAAFGYALNAVDRVAGRKTRDQLESQLGNIAQCQ
ncbi:hypothetical protein VNI00_017974 [Paramarasmius palmivorus]|uniref:Xylosidase arabinosidase n=1 Tax=Paramarasmius palmivorus TaxID=297713 RepID=A0AAW0B1F2_9AGAR